jgi:methanethiol S-methyltransferase
MVHALGRTRSACGGVDDSEDNTLKRFSVLIYGVTCYASFLGALLYLIGFLNGLLVPKGIDDGEPGPFGWAMAIDVALVLLFAVQHTVMARPWFKRWWKRNLCEPIARSTFVLVASLLLLLLVWQWRALPDLVWHVESTALVYVLYGVQALGWALVLLSSFLINHFELFGLQQVYLYWRRREATPAAFRLPWLYRLVRHPLMLGFLVAFWSTPLMTHGHLLFAVSMTAYILVGIQAEERDLVGAFGRKYRDYQKGTPMLLPVPRSPRGDTDV